MNQIIRFFLLFGIFISIDLLCQPFKNEKIITINDGLSQNSALTLLQDKNGFIWIGTKDGLNRFDGREFKVYKNRLSKNSIPDNRINNLYEDSDGNIWISTSNGFCKFDIISEKFTSFFSKNKKSSGKIINAILEDYEQNIWVGTKSGLTKFVRLGKSFVEEANSEKIVNEFRDKSISCLFEDGKQNLWIGTNSNGLFQIPKNHKIIQKINFAKADMNSNFTNNISTIAELSNGVIVFGTFGAGIFLSDNRKLNFLSYKPKFGDDSGLSFIEQIIPLENSFYVLTNRKLYFSDNNSDEILWENKSVTSPTSFIIDKSGIIWIGSDGSGIVKLEPNLKNFRTTTKENDKNNGFGFASVRAILKVESRLFVGGYTGLLESKNYNSSEVAKWENVEMLKKFNIYSLGKDATEKNTIWVGTEGSGLYKYNFLKKKITSIYSKNKRKQFAFPSNSIYDILICKNNDVYFGTGSGVSRFNFLQQKIEHYANNPADSNSLVYSNIYALCEDSFGNIWIGSDNSGISVYNPQKNTFDNKFSKLVRAISISQNLRINVIFEDSRKNIWIGTSGGLLKFISKKNDFMIFTLADGLPNDYVYGILEDNFGNLWLSTNKGISKFCIKTKKNTNYDYNFGLQSNEFNTASFYKAENGEMFFGGIKGITSFFPENIKQNSFAPKVVITNFKKYNQNVELPKSISNVDKIVLQYNDNFFSFDFMMPTFENPSLHTFSYKLIGLEERWITLNKGEKTASFSSVPHGEYLLVVKGANHDGIWSEETKLKIEIIPAFWDTIWFKVFVSISLFTIAFALVSSRIRRLKKEKEIQRDLTNKLLNSQEEERKNISSELHDDLGQNLLVVKNRLMLARRDRIYEKNIDESLDILDLSIHKISNISHLLHPSELEELGLSLAIETMIDRIQTAAELLVNTNFHNFDDYFADEEKINVFRIIQEAMNNVIKHANATKVNLSTKIENKDFVLLISDNGKGFEILEQNSSENRPHLGLKGMKERVIMLKGKMKVNSQKGNGTAISIIFSNRIKNENR